MVFLGLIYAKYKCFSESFIDIWSAISEQGLLQAYKAISYLSWTCPQRCLYPQPQQDAKYSRSACHQPRKSVVLGQAILP